VGGLEDILTQRRSHAEDDASAQAATLVAQALEALQRAATDKAGLSDAREELVAARLAIEGMTGRIEGQLEEEKEQRKLLGDQLTGLAGSLDRLVTHLQGLSQLMADLLERLAEPAAPPTPAEAPFLPGGEGITLILASVPGFQGLMDIQKALTAMEQVAGASVERFQEGDSRIILHLKAPITATDLATNLRGATGYGAIVEEARPELLRLRIKIIPGAS
jgi:hypothetical protein